MTRNVLTITKWLPLETLEHKEIFSECKKLQISCQVVFERLANFINDFQLKNVSKVHHTINDKESLMENLDKLYETTEHIVEELNAMFHKLKYIGIPLVEAKYALWKYILWKKKLKICYMLQELIANISFLFIYYGETILTLTLKLSNLFNHCLTMDLKHGLGNSINHCSNTCPFLMHPFRKLSITKLLQILAQNRAELCSHKLIDCLLETYKFHDFRDNGDDDRSDTSSIEIYRALTKHITPPLDNKPELTESEKQLSIQESCSFGNMEELISYEEQNVLDLLNCAIKIAPLMLGHDSIRRSKKTGELKISTEARNKVLDYYQEILWGEVGNFLEHIILWWGASPLSARAPHSSQHLREWIMQFTPTAEAPTFIVSALQSLADALGVHAVSTSWDQHFRYALVASKANSNADTGRLFCEMLTDLVTLCNQCEVTSDWIVGAPLDELPLVEQIPILHRLDHSVHTTRLWAAAETKKLANIWNVESFFMITQCEIVNCLDKLNNLRLADHTIEIEKGGLGVHVQVCATMRAKLVSEVKVNIQKLKELPKECVDCLACVCRTVSLANLQMVFPEPKYWKQNRTDVSEKPSIYVDKYLNEILSPVLAATEDHLISNMILQLMCESWLDHIYKNKIKFSQHGAYQLLTDFGSIGTWLINCPIITQIMRKKMLKNEVLRRCEGVGKLLLRSPGEQIRMTDKVKKLEVDGESPKSNNSELMPAEMYVPNQEQWLELRASKKKSYIIPICCGVNHL